MSANASLSLNPPKIVQNSVLVKGPTMGNMNLKSSASNSGFFDPNSASGDKRFLAKEITFSGSNGKFEFFSVSFSSRIPISGLSLVHLAQNSVAKNCQNSPILPKFSEKRPKLGLLKVNIGML